MSGRIISYIVLLICWANVATLAQTGPVSTQYFLGLGRNNPGLTGIDPFINVNLGYKQAWKGFSDNSNTAHVNIFGQIRKNSELEAGKSTFRISDPKIYEELKRSKTIRRKHGAGLSVDAVQLGFFRNITAKVHYAYHLPVTESYNLSLGTSVGYFQQRIDYTGLVVRDEVNDSFYQNLITQSDGNQARLLIDFGAAFYSDQLYVAVNGKSLVDQIIGGDNMLENFSNPMEFSFLAGYKLSVNPKFRIHPNMDLRYNLTYGLSVLGSVRAIYNEFIYGGAGIQDDHRLSFLSGIKVYDNMYIHYSYDHYMGDVRQFAEGTHEFTLVFTLLNRYNSQPYSW